MINNFDLSSLTEKEKLYINTEYETITPVMIALRTAIGVVLVALSSLVTPSAEGKVPFSNYFGNTKKRAKFTRYRNAVINKLNGRNSKKNDKILEKLNSSEFVLDENIINNEDKNIEEIYAEYMKEHTDDSTKSDRKTESENTD